MRGVALSHFKRLVNGGRHGEIEVQPSWTVQECVDLFVRPSSRDACCCLFDLVPAECTGRPTYFISHTWSRTLEALLALLEGHLSPNVLRGEDPLIWLDIYAINQHPYVGRGQLKNEDVANLARVIGATEVTLFCLDSQCVALTRIWCLYEVS